MTKTAAPRTHSHHHGNPTGGRIYLVCLGLSIAAVGALFFWLMLASYLRATAMREWPQVDAEILVSEVEQRQLGNGPPEFRANFLFGYEWEGRPYTGEFHSLRGNAWSTKHDLVRGRAMAFPAGTTATCLVDPENPSLAVLTADSKGPGYSLWFPGVFVIGGLGISIRAILHRSAQPAKTASK